MVDKQDIKDIATLIAKMEVLEGDVKVLKEYKAKTERYGWFAMGMIAVGTVIASSLEKPVSKLMAFFQ